MPSRPPTSSSRWVLSSAASWVQSHAVGSANARAGVGADGRYVGGERGHLDGGGAADGVADAELAELVAPPAPDGAAHLGDAAVLVADLWCSPAREVADLGGDVAVDGV